MQDPQLQKALQILKDHFNFQKAYLFGSRSEGTHQSDSDYDLVLVVPESSVDAFERRVHARTLLKGLMHSYDVFVYTQAEFEESKSDFGSIAETAMNTGREIDFL